MPPPTDHADAPNPVGFYQDPVVYDILHAQGTADEARGVERLARSVHGIPDGPMSFLEPACGTARHLRWLATAGHRCVGFDLDAGMIEDARSRAARAGIGKRTHLFVADMASFASHIRKPVRCAYNLINTIRHLDSDESMLAHLDDVARSLTRNGFYIVGLSTTVYGVEMPNEDVWRGARGPCRVTQVANYLPPEEGSRWETVLSHLHIERPGGDEHRDSTYRLRTYSLDEWTSLIERSSLRIDRVTDEDGADVVPQALGYAWYVLARR
ncbi:MAG: class I SAM-dependent methyltransferase [Planctomycetota bacterium]